MRVEWYAFFLPVLLRICCSSCIVEYFGSEKRSRISARYPKASASAIRLFNDISPFCSNRATLLTGTPDNPEISLRVIFFSIRRFLKSLAIRIDTSSDPGCTYPSKKDSILAVSLLIMAIQIKYCLYAKIWIFTLVLPQSNVFSPGSNVLTVPSGTTIPHGRGIGRRGGDFWGTSL